MTDTAIAETPEAALEIQAVDDNAPMTVERAAEVLAERKANRLGTKPEEEAEPEPETPEGEEVEVEAETDEEVADEDEVVETDENDVLSEFKIDWDSLTEEQSAEMAYRNKSGGGKTIGKQRKEIRELKAKLETANNATKEAISVAPASDNPYAKLHKAEEVSSTLKQAQANVDFWDTKLDKAIDDEVYEVEHNGEMVSTKSIRTFVKEQRAAAKHLKSRQTEIKKVEELFDTEDEKIETLRLDLGMEEDSKASKAYDKYLADPSFQLIKNIAPEYALKLLPILAHAAVNENVEAPKKKPAKRAAPKSQGGSSLPKGGSGESSAQGQLSALTKIAHDTTKSRGEREKAVRTIRALKRQR
jgi:hypothetical protein